MEFILQLLNLQNQNNLDNFTKNATEFRDVSLRPTPLTWPTYGLVRPIPWLCRKWRTRGESVLWRRQSKGARNVARWI